MLAITDAKTEALREAAAKHDVCFALLNQDAFVETIEPEVLASIRAKLDAVARTLTGHGYQHVDGTWVPPVVPA